MGFFFFHVFILNVHVVNSEHPSPFAGLSGTECAWLGLSTHTEEFTRLGCILSWLLSGVDIMDLC